MAKSRRTSRPSGQQRGRVRPAPISPAPTDGAPSDMMSEAERHGDVNVVTPGNRARKVSVTGAHTTRREFKPAPISGSWEQARRSRERRMQWTLAAGFGIALVLAVAFFLYYQSQLSSAYQGTRLADEGQTHVPDTTTPTYQHYPPASGPHFPAPAPWGSINQPLPEGLFVHNLEHGGIALLYKCEGDCSGIKNQVTQLAAELPRDPSFNEVKFVATSYSRMDHPFAVLAWDYIHEMDTFDAAYIKGFYNAHVDKGPEQVS